MCISWSHLKVGQQHLARGACSSVRQKTGASRHTANGGPENTQWAAEGFSSKATKKQTIKNI